MPPNANVRPEMLVVEALVVDEVSAEMVLKYEVEEAWIPAVKLMIVDVLFTATPKLVPGVNGNAAASVPGVT